MGQVERESPMEQGRSNQSDPTMRVSFARRVSDPVRRIVASNSIFHLPAGARARFG